MSLNNKGQGEGLAIAIVVLLGLFGLGAGCYIYPMYNVYAHRMAGQAELQRAESNRNIAVLEARAKKESATLLAEAEVERAKGVAKSNEIIGQSLTGNESYLHYLWINELAAAGHVIYVPTEANLPILEASRLTKKSKVKEN